MLANIPILSICWAVLYLFFIHRTPSHLKSGAKTIPLFLLATGALLSFQIGLAIALFLSALGDFALSKEGPRAFLLGLASFALAHIVYILVFLDLITFWGNLWVLVGIFGVIALSTEIWLAPYTGGLRAQVRLYVIIIATMAVFASMLPSEFRLVTLGALLFLASDIILSLQLFRLRQDALLKTLSGYAVWVLYFVGQFLIYVGIMDWSWKLPI